MHLGTRTKLCIQMKILYFSRDYTTHDHRFLLKLTESLPTHQFFYLRFGSGPLLFEQRPLPAGVHLVEWAGLHRQINTPTDCLPLMADFERVLAEIKPDLIHAGPVQTCGFMTALAGAHPHLLMSWGSDILTTALRDDLNGWTTAFTLRHADGFICDSDWVRDTARQFAPIPDDTVTQFAWGIDLPQFPFVPPQPHNQFTVLSTRSWEPLYGTDTLVEGFCMAWQTLRASLPHPIKLVMMGGGSLANQIHNIIARYGAGDVVQFTGMLPHKQQAAQFAAADVYISCAHTDGTSISLLEAMATGLPVIVTDIPSNREWVTPFKPEGFEAEANGWLTTKGDVQAVAAAIVDAAQLPPNTRLAIAQRNRAVVEARGDWQKNSQLLLQAYQRLGIVTYTPQKNHETY